MLTKKLCSNALFYVLFRNHEWKASITMVLWWVSLSWSSLLYASSWFAQGILIVPVIDIIVTVHYKTYSKIVELVSNVFPNLSHCSYWLISFHSQTLFVKNDPWKSTGNWEYWYRNDMFLVADSTGSHSLLWYYEDNSEWSH